MTTNTQNHDCQTAEILSIQNIASRVAAVGLTVEQTLACTGRTQQETIQNFKQAGLGKAGSYRLMAKVADSIYITRRNAKSSAANFAAQSKYADPLTKVARQERERKISSIRQIRSLRYLTIAEKIDFVSQVTVAPAGFVQKPSLEACRLDKIRHFCTVITRDFAALEIPRSTLEKMEPESLADIVELPPIAKQMPSGSCDTTIPLGKGRALVIQRPKIRSWDKYGSRCFPRMGPPEAFLIQIDEKGISMVKQTVWAHRGDWLAKIATAFDLPTAPSVEPGLGSAAWVEVGIENGTTKIALLNGNIKLYRAESGGHNYHAKTSKAACFGLCRKLIKLRRNPLLGEIITRAKAAKNWGFCRQGITAFCHQVGINSSSIALHDLQELVKKSQSAGIDLSPWENELKTAGLI